MRRQHHARASCSVNTSKYSFCDDDDDDDDGVDGVDVLTPTCPARLGKALRAATERGVDRAKGMAEGERVPFFACGLSSVMHPKVTHQAMACTALAAWLRFFFRLPLRDRVRPDR